MQRFSDPHSNSGLRLVDSLALRQGNRPGKHKASLRAFFLPRPLPWLLSPAFRHWELRCLRFHTAVCLGKRHGKDFRYSEVLSIERIVRLEQDEAPFPRGFGLALLSSRTPAIFLRSAPGETSSSCELRRALCKPTLNPSVPSELPAQIECRLGNITKPGSAWAPQGTPMAIVS